MKCPRGQVYRKSYTRKISGKTVRIPGTCLRSRPFGLITINPKVPGLAVENSDDLITNQINPNTLLRSQTRYDRPLNVDRSRFRGYRMTKRALKTCPSGYVKRSAFVRITKRGKRSYVPEQCISDIGSPGKGYRNGPGIGALRKGELTKYGYENVISLSLAKRHAALQKAVDEYGSLGVWRKLNAVAVYTKRTAPHISKIFKEDMAWIRAKFGIKAF